MPTVVVVDYDPQWPVVFEQLAEPIRRTLAAACIPHAVEHVGSTSVPGLAAKPIIDLGVVVPDASHKAPVLERLAGLGYQHRGDLGVPGREAFHRPAGAPAHHLYLYAEGCEALRNHRAVRDALRADPALAEAYGRLKKQLATEFPEDIDRYVAGKTPLLIQILRAAGFGEETLAAIEGINRPKS